MSNSTSQFLISSNTMCDFKISEASLSNCCKATSVERENKTFFPADFGIPGDVWRRHITPYLDSLSIISFTLTCRSSINIFSGSIIKGIYINSRQQIQYFIRANLKIQDVIIKNNFLGHTAVMSGIHVLSGEQLVIKDKDGACSVWDLESLSRSTRFLPCFEDELDFVILPLANRRLVFGMSSGRIRVWDVDAKSTMVLLSGTFHTKDPRRNAVLALTAVGTSQVASGGADGNIKLWKLSTGLCVKTMTGHKNVSAGVSHT